MERGVESLHILGAGERVVEEVHERLQRHLTTPPLVDGGEEPPELDELIEGDLLRFHVVLLLLLGGAPQPRTIVETHFVVSGTLFCVPRTYFLGDATCN